VNLNAYFFTQRKIFLELFDEILIGYSRITIYRRRKGVVGVLIPIGIFIDSGNLEIRIGGAKEKIIGKLNVLKFSGGFNDRRVDDNRLFCNLFFVCLFAFIVIGLPRAFVIRPS